MASPALALPDPDDDEIGYANPRKVTAKTDITAMVYDADDNTVAIGITRGPGRV